MGALDNLASNAGDPTDFYELLELLGKGSYGLVYKARRLTDSELMAVKLISLDEKLDDLDELREEIRILQVCNHANVVTYFGSYYKDNNLWVCS